MKVCGIVCEYNPFHNGHLHHITETKKRGIDATVCVMSGNFVQRAEFSMMHKRARAEAAVRCGADVVIELPLPWAIASAERFAYGAVSVLDALGAVTHISFGAETEDISALSDTAKLLVDGSLDELILAEYENGISYAKARELAVEKVAPALSEILRTPNNILAVEYLKALIKLNSDISPLAIKRHGADHDRKNTSDGIASASYLRELVAGGDDISAYIPASSNDIFIRETEKLSAPVFTGDADKAILSVLKRLSPSDFCRYSDVSEGLEYRLCDAVACSSTLDDAIARAKTKRYAHSRIRRIFLNAFLDVDKSFAKEAPPYARILAFNDTGRAVIKSAKKISRIPIITKPSAIKNESEKARDLFALERRADDIYALFMKNPEKQGGTLTESPIYVES